MQGIFLDIETTGLNPFRHSPIDIALKVIDLCTGKEAGSYSSLIQTSQEMWDKNDPISLEVNGLTREEVNRGKDKSQVGKEIILIFNALQVNRSNAVFICQNPSFDRGFFNQIIDVYVQELLNWPYHWLDLASMYWAMRAQKSKQAGEKLPEKLAFSKNEIAGYYHLPEETGPHRAVQGVEHLILCYQAVIGAFPL